jgi:hypothetical protein
VGVGPRLWRIQCRIGRLAGPNAAPPVARASHPNRRNLATCLRSRLLDIVHFAGSHARRHFDGLASNGILNLALTRSVQRANKNPIMQQAPRHFRARMCGRLIEPLEDLDLPQDEEFVLALRPFHESNNAEVIAALNDSAGAWSTAEHPELKTREDLDALVAGLRQQFERAHGE